MPDPRPAHVGLIKELRSVVRGWRAAGEGVALVPTMGALHDGHIGLVRLAKARAQRVVTSVFVNPAQFAPHEDLDRYPRTFEADLAALATVACDLVWAPTVSEMYPPGHATRVVPAGAANGLETDFRPHFFAGVATVCTKLFTQVAPDFAIYGEKDFQQLAVMRQIVRDLDLPLEIVGAPTVRESDGLAMSSRNRYLTESERKIAPTLNRVLTSLARSLHAAGAPLDPIKADAFCEAASSELLAAGFAKVDYLVVRDAATLGPITTGASAPLRILAAAWLGKTRLIDNVPA